MKTISLEEGQLFLKEVNKDYIDLIKDVWSDNNKDIYYLFKEDIIITLNDSLKSSNFFYSYYSFEQNFVNENEYKLKHVIGEVYSKPDPLRFNYIINKERIRNISKNKDLFLKKLNTLLNINVSPYQEINIEVIKKINDKLQYYQKKNKDFLNKIEIPLLIFFGENTISKYGGQWKLKTASNSIGNDFLIPYIQFGNKEINIDIEIFNLLYIEVIKDEDFLIDVDIIKELIRIDINTRINIIKQNKGNQ